MKAASRCLGLLCLLMGLFFICVGTSCPQTQAGPTSIGDVEWHNSKYNKIAYSDHPQAIPPPLETLMRRLLQFQVEQIKGLGLPPFAGTATLTWEQSESRKAAFWEEVRKAIPEKNLPPYSPKAYAHWIAWDVPRLVAPYGIFARLTNKIQWNWTKPDFKVFESFLTFYQIQKMEKVQVERAGKPMVLDLAWLESPLWMDDQPELRAHFQMSVGESYYQTIFLLRKQVESVLWDNLSEDERKSRPETLAKLEPIRNEDVSARVITAKDPYTSAVEYAYAKLTYDKIKMPETVEDEKQRGIAHEAQHVLDESNATYRQAWAPVETSQVVPYLKRDNSDAHHFETDGILSEIRYAPRKHETLRQLLKRKRSNAVLDDYDYDSACLWILSRMAELVSKNPARYGIKVNPVLALSAECQFYLQLPDMPKPALERLADDVIAIHQQRYDEDFGDDYLNSRHNK